MGAYCGAAAKIYDANEAIRVNNTGPRSQELLATINVTKKGRDGRIPFVQACKYGRQRMVEFMIKHDIKQRITAEYVDAGLLQCCGGDTTRNLVFILVEVSGANVNAQDVFGNTPLINLAKKSNTTTKFTLGQRLETAVYLLEKGARINHKNREGMSAITIAVRDLNERFALLLAEKGADIMQVFDFMSTTKGQSRNWVGGSVMTRYGWNCPEFLDEIKSWFYDAFGDAPRGDESLNEYQLKVFIGRLLKEAYRAGLMPNAAFFSDGAMDPHDIEAILERRARDMIHGYLAARRKKTNKFFWDELFPIVKSFYTTLWNHERPKDADAELDMDMPTTEEKKSSENRVDYGYGTLAEAALTPDTGSAMVQSTLPPDWTAVVDPASGQVYYVNVVTQETKWEPPGGMEAYEP